jgi:hypothetical protein
MRKLFVLLTTVAVVLAFTLPAMAQAQWSFYGQARMWTAYEKVTKETVPALTAGTGPLIPVVPATTAAAWDGGLSGRQDDSEVVELLQGNSRIGALVKNGDITAGFEYGSGPDLRLLYGKWNFSKDGQIEVGQDYTPYFYIVSGLCGPGGGECNGIGLGTIYGGRNPELRLNYMGFSVALVKPKSATVPYNLNTTFAGDASTNFTTPYTASLTGYTTNTDQTLPRLEASYSANIGPVNIFVGGLYNQYKINYSSATTAKQDTTINSYLLAAGGKFAYGPFYFNASGQYGTNPNNGNAYATLIPAYFSLNPVTNKSEDAQYYSGQGIIGFKVSDMISFEGGYIIQNAKVKDPGVTAASTSIDVEETTGVWYVQSVISPAKNFFIVPEVGSIDYKDLKVQGFTDRKLGETFWFGIKWQINF